MKKLFLLTLVICLAFSSVTAFAYGVTIDLAETDCDMIFLSDTVYLSVEDIASALGKNTHWDERTQSIFANGIYLFPKKGDGVTVYVDGEKKIEGKAVLQDGKTYLPAHVTAAAFELSAAWDDALGTVLLTTASPSSAGFTVDTQKTYAIINKASGKALSAPETGLTAEDYAKTAYQEFRFIETEFEGYYHIQSVASGKNLDVNSHGTTPGVSIITWETGTGDNQKFTVETVPGGTLISARSCHLPIEPSGSGIIQNTRTLSSNQKWDIIQFGTDYVKKEITPGEKLVVTTIPQKPEKLVEKETYRVFSIGEQTLTDTQGLSLTEEEATASEMWTLTEISADVYVITNLATGKSLDVSARSLDEGGSIITYSTNSDANQRWILEAASDGTYLIKSVHSSLYLTIGEDGALIQMGQNSDLKQKWTVTITH